MPKPPLTIVGTPASATLQPPRPLNDPGRSLWDRVHREFVIEDAQGIELLTIACEQTDRVAELRAQIAKDGLMIRTQTGYRDNPLLKHELQSRALISRALARLGIDPPRPGPGRPPGSAA
jgi:hypothetical protein